MLCVQLFMLIFVLFQLSTHSPPTPASAGQHPKDSPAGNDKLQQQIMAMYPPNHPQHHDMKMYAAYYSKVSTQTTTSSSLASKVSAAEQPNFSLYGYQPYGQPHAYISPDKLPAVSQEGSGSQVSPKGATTSTASSSSSQQLVKDMYKQSVIVSAKPSKELSPGSRPQEGSITHGTARPQQPQLSPGRTNGPYIPPPHHTQLSPTGAKRPPSQANGPKQIPDIAPRKKPRTSSMSEGTAQISPPMGSPPHQSPLTSPKSTSGATAPSSAFIDSFRSFVENAVQSAFFQESQKGQTTSTVPSNKAISPATTTTTSSLPPASMAATTTATCAPTQSLPAFASSVPRPGPPSTPGGASSTCSLPDTVVNTTSTRVANGCVDNDSDTMSAPSPPPPPPAPQPRDNTASPHPANKHTRAHKKAWLQRYTDDTVSNPLNPQQAAQTPPPVTTTTTPPQNRSSPIVSNPTPTPMETEQDTEEKSVKDCYVNCSYISPTQDGANNGKNPVKERTATPPVSATPPPTNTQSPLAKPTLALIDQIKKEAADESTTSASEAEAQMGERPHKKKAKRKKQQKDTQQDRQRSPSQEETKPSAPKKVKVNESL